MFAFPQLELRRRLCMFIFLLHELRRSSQVQVENLDHWYCTLPIITISYCVCACRCRNMNLKQLALQRNCMQKADNCSFSDVGWYIDLLTERGATLLFWETCSFSPFLVKFVFFLFLVSFFIPGFSVPQGVWFVFILFSSVKCWSINLSIWVSYVLLYSFNLSPKIQVIVICNCNKVSR